MYIYSLLCMMKKARDNFIPRFLTWYRALRFFCLWDFLFFVSHCQVFYCSFSTFIIDLLLAFIVDILLFFSSDCTNLHSWYFFDILWCLRLQKQITLLNLMKERQEPIFLPVNCRISVILTNSMDKTTWNDLSWSVPSYKAKGKFDIVST